MDNTLKGTKVEFNKNRKQKKKNKKKNSGYFWVPPRIGSIANVLEAASISRPRVHLDTDIWPPSVAAALNMCPVSLLDTSFHPFSMDLSD
jgi:hypothetical protein